MIIFVRSPVLVGFTTPRITVSPTRGHVDATVRVLTGTLKHDVQINCYTQDGTATGKTM